MKWSQLLLLATAIGMPGVAICAPCRKDGICSREALPAKEADPILSKQYADVVLFERDIDSVAEPDAPVGLTKRDPGFTKPITILPKLSVPPKSALRTPTPKGEFNRAPEFRSGSREKQVEIGAPIDHPIGGTIAAPNSPVRGPLRNKGVDSLELDHILQPLRPYNPDEKVAGWLRKQQVASL